MMILLSFIITILKVYNGFQLVDIIIFFQRKYMKTKFILNQYTAWMSILHYSQLCEKYRLNYKFFLLKDTSPCYTLIDFDINKLLRDYFLSPLAFKIIN